MWLFLVNMKKTHTYIYQDTKRKESEEEQAVIMEKREKEIMGR